MQDPDMVLAAVKSDVSGTAYSKAASAFRFDHEIVLAAIKGDVSGMALRHLAENFSGQDGWLCPSTCSTVLQE
eukprot:3663072-Amphidinium_carterae.1